MARRREKKKLFNNSNTEEGKETYGIQGRFHSMKYESIR